MLGNLHVRFGEGDEETCPGNETRRFIPTLPRTPRRSRSSQRLSQGPAMQQTGRLALYGYDQYPAKMTSTSERQMPPLDFAGRNVGCPTPDRSPNTRYWKGRK